MIPEYWYIVAQSISLLLLAISEALGLHTGSTSNSILQLLAEIYKAYVVGGNGDSNPVQQIPDLH